MLYHALWVLVALGLVAALSAAITRHKGRHDERRQQALRLARALHRYSDWVLAQRLVALFHGEDPEAAAALDEACALRLAWFPELAADMARLLAVHKRLLAFLASQQGLWQRDPQHWLASEHDQRYMALWRQHCSALQVLLARLDQLARVRKGTRGVPGESTFA